MADVVDDRGVDTALRTVMDPCSRWNETNLNIVEMGLVRSVVIEDRVATVVLGLTDPSCVFFFDIAQGIRTALLAAGDVDRVEIDSDAEEIWTEELMEPAARSRLSIQRRVRLLQVLTPPPRPAHRVAPLEA
jgi:metal-sulfur cluster biosynthetic enzyme